MAKIYLGLHFCLIENWDIGLCYSQTHNCTQELDCLTNSHSFSPFIKKISSFHTIKIQLQENVYTVSEDFQISTSTAQALWEPQKYTTYKRTQHNHMLTTSMLCTEIYIIHKYIQKLKLFTKYNHDNFNKKIKFPIVKSMEEKTPAWPIRRDHIAPG